MTKPSENHNNDDGSEELSSSSSLSNGEDDDDELEDEEASSFISIQLLQNKFPPVFTHQCFENEVIPGYTSLLSSSSKEEEEADDECEEDTSERKKLSINITLAPSCRYCSVSIIVRDSDDVHPGKEMEKKECKMIESALGEDEKINAGNGGKKNENTDRINVLPMSIVKKRPRGEKRDNIGDEANDKDTGGNEERVNVLPISIIKKRPREEKRDNISDTINNKRTEKVEKSDNEPIKKKQKKTVQFDNSDAKNEKDGENESNENVKDSNNSKKMMRIDEIYQKISKALPPILNKLPPEIANEQNENDFDITPTKDQVDQIKNDYLSKPFGKILKEYQRSKQCDSNDTVTHRDTTFVLSLANGTNNTEVATYHSSIQNLSLWFIESASTSDISSDEGGGYWKVLYLFRKHSLSSGESKYSLVGYTTLFHFYSPFKKPKAGIIMRICQVVVFPPYQRCGHGKVMLQTVYSIAAGLYDSILKKDEDNNEMLLREVVEVNVEDPAPAFTCLRDRVDYECLCDSLASFVRAEGGDGDNKCEKKVSANDPNVNTSVTSAPMIDTKLMTGDIMDPSYFTPLSQANAMRGGLKGRITSRQIQIAHEIYKLDALERKIKELVSEKKEETIEMLQKRYRLMVKKRLNKLHQEDLGLRKTKKEKQEKLAEYYDEVHKHYLSVLGRN